MPSIPIRPVKDRKHKDRPQPQRPLPPPVTIIRKGENLDRRIRNLESLGNGVFIGNVLASYMALPGLVGFWPMSSVQRSTGNAYDLSGQGRTLTYNGNPAYTYFNGLVPYIDLDGTGDYLSRADETDLDITGAETIYTTGAAGLTIGAWVWFDAAGGTEVAMSKWNPTGNQASYLLWKSNGELGSFDVSSNGSAATEIQGSSITSATFTFLVGRFTPSTELAVFVNSAKATNTVSIPASIFVSTAIFTIGGRSDAASLVNGRVALAFLCANALGDDLISSLYQTSRVIFSV